MNLSSLMAAFIADRLTKEWAKKNLAENTDYPKVLGGLRFKRVRNYGLPNNVLGGQPETVKKVTTAVMIFSILFAAFGLRRAAKAEKTAFSLMLGGGLSNLADRYLDGYVTDFISFKDGKTTVFNLADFFIFAGGAFLALFTIFRKS